MKLNLLWAFMLPILLVSSFQLSAQRNCGAMGHMHAEEQADPHVMQVRQQIEAKTQAYINNLDENSRVDGIITIPVVVHILYNGSSQNISAAQVQSQIDVLNDDFRRLNSDADGTWSQAADTEIEFCMATIDPSGNATTGITRTSTSVSGFGTNDGMKFNSSGGKDAWPASDYLNMWTCDIGGGILGYAQFPGGSAATDGVVMDYRYFGTIGTASAPFDLGRTATHEVGHWLNLRHIWGDGGCNVDDYVSDTPTSDGANYGCATSHTSCSSLDMVQNYMDYSDDACMNLFTSGQKTRMRALFAAGGAKASLLSSGACGGTPAEPTCTDGIQNQGETGVDCGGPCAACPTCDAPANLGAATTDISASLSWDAAATAGSYNVRARLIGATSWSQGSNLNPPVNFTGLTACTNYEFQVQSNCSAETSGWSASYNFTTTGCSASSCNDGIMNGNETGVDCGGDCPACATCDDGIMNGDETGVDCGGSCPNTCSTACSYVNIDSNDFESSLGIWNDGGSDCVRKSDPAYSNGSFSVRLRDNTNTSVMTTDVQNWSAYDEITVDFSYFARSMENNEDFWLQVSTDGGASFSTISAWARGTDFENNVRMDQSVTITGTFTSTSVLRFRCDASGNGDYVHIDDVNISGCVNASRDVRPVDVLAYKGDAGNDESMPHLSIGNLYPNPASSVLNVNFAVDSDTDVQFTITDLSGRVLLSETRSAMAGEQTQSVDVSQLGGGYYFITLQTGSESVVKKFVTIK